MYTQTAQGVRSNNKPTDILTRTASLMTIKNTIAVPRSELMQMNLRTQFLNTNLDKLQDKMELKNKSQERMKKWPSTINAYKKKKDQFRFERFKADEERRREIDIEEEQYQTLVKKETLLRSNKLLYENNDRVRTFQSKMLLSDAMQERDAQIQLQNYKKIVENQREQLFEEMMQEKIIKEEELEKIRKMKLFEKKKDVAKTIKEQHDEMKDKYIKKIQEEKIEGELMKIKVQAALEEEQQKAQAKKLAVLENQRQVFELNQKLHEEKEKIKEKERIEDEKIQVYAHKKQQIQDMRKMREELKFKEKQAQRQKLIDAQVEALAQKLNDENIFLDKQIEEVEIKAEEVEKMKRERIERMKAGIDKSHRIKEEVTKTEKEQIKTIKGDFQQFWSTRNQELYNMEEKEKFQVRKRNQDNIDYLKNQMDERQRKYIEKFEEDFQTKENLERLREKEEDHFQKWASEKIQQQYMDGKNIQPLLKELNSYKYR